MPSFAKMVTATFLITGTSVGGGMLGLPVVTGRHGFLPATIMMVISGFMMLCTGLLYVELSVATPDEESSERLTHFYLGPFGHRLFQLIFLFMSFASLMAYTDGGGGHILQFLNSIYSGITIPKGIEGVIFVLALLTTGALSDHGIRFLNNLLMVGMIFSYFLLIGPGMNEIHWPTLMKYDLRELWQPLPIFLTAFSCQAFVVPTLTKYLDYDAQSIKRCLVGGYLLSFIIYFIWELLVLGVVPLHGPNSLSTAYEQGRPVTFFLKEALSTPWMGIVAEFFSFFALTTSFLGIFYGLSHFIKELLPTKVLKKESPLRPLLIKMIIVIPILIINFYGKGIFLKAMDLTGALGDTLINGLLPILMIYHLRYGVKQLPDGHRYHLFGGWPFLIILSAFYALVGISSFF